jgi:hypothetical protein
MMQPIAQIALLDERLWTGVEREEGRQSYISIPSELRDEFAAYFHALGWEVIFQPNPNHKFITHARFRMRT